LHLVHAQLEAVKRILIVELKQGEQLFFSHLVALQFVDVCVAEVDHVLA